MSVDGADITDADFAACCTALTAAAEGMADPCTEFELCTALALYYFAERRCDIVVLETGLGGRLDATNVIPRPECAVIMNIGLDHTAVLGDTPELIAAEKAGIFKGGRAAAYDLTGGVRRVLEAKAAETGTEINFADFDEIVPISDSMDGQEFIYRGEKYRISLPRRASAPQRRRGARGRRAAARVGLGHIRRGRRARARLRRVAGALRARAHGAGLRRRRRAPTHNASRRPRRRSSAITRARGGCCSSGRSPTRTGGTWRGCSSPRRTNSSARRRRASGRWTRGTLAEFLRGEGCRAEAFGTIEAACAAAYERAKPDGMACCLGSLYMAGAARSYLLGLKEGQK